MTTVMSIQEKLEIEQDIMHYPELAKQLDDVRYNPEHYRKLTGKPISYLAVYCNMVETEINDRRREEVTEEKRKKKRNK